MHYCDNYSYGENHFSLSHLPVGSSTVLLTYLLARLTLETRDAYAGMPLPNIDSALAPRSPVSLAVYAALHVCSEPGIIHSVI